MSPANAPVIVTFDPLENQCKVDSLVDFPQSPGVAHRELQEQGLTRLQRWILRIITESKHRLANALVDLRFPHIEAPHC
jgi:hypothetical protein